MARVPESTPLGRSHPFHLRFRQRSLFRREVSAGVDIDAPIDLVWDVLADLDHYTWNPLSPRATARALAVGEPVELEVHLPGRPKRMQTEWINLVEPGKTICWGLHLPHPLFLVGNRVQELTPLGPGRTRYFTVDRFSGLLTPLVMLLYGEPMRAGFQAMADALKAHCEAKVQA